MDQLPQEEQDRIVAALKQKGATRPCPRCNANAFALLGGYFNHAIEPRLGGMSIGGPSIPTVVVVCSNCGWVAEHAVGALGLLPEPPQEEPGAESKEHP